jgi:dTDP-glucose pyrophosphorylase
VERRLVGVILAAGRGTRIKPLNLYTPKPLLPVCNKPVIEYQLEDMGRIGIKRIFVVVGHLKNEIMTHLGDGSRWGFEITYVEQKQMLGIAHAVAQLEPVIDSPFLLFLGDIFVVSKNLESMVDLFWRREAGAVLAVKHEPNPEFIRRNFSVMLHPSGAVVRVIEKPRYLPNSLKGCGLYMFDLAIFDSIRRTPRTAMRDEYEITNAIQILIDDGFPVYPAEALEWDMNLTFAYDLLDCNLRELKRLGLARLVGDNVQMPPGTVIEDSVIGDNVVIRHPITVRHSLVLSGSVLETGDNVVDFVITPDTKVNCADREDGSVA